MLNQFITLLIDKLKEKSLEYVLLIGLLGGFLYYAKQEIEYNKEQTASQLNAKSEQMSELINKLNRVTSQRNSALLAYLSCQGLDDKSALVELNKILKEDEVILK